jgi:hypothetical protein
VVTDGHLPHRCRKQPEGRASQGFAEAGGKQAAGGQRDDGWRQAMIARVISWSARNHRRSS